MTGANPWSDGTALAGHLHDVVGVDVTTAIGRCTTLQLPVPEET